MRRYTIDLIIPNHFWQKPVIVTRHEIHVNEIVIPANFATDGATTPRFLWPLIPPIGKWWPAALAHDYALTIMPRAQADRVFLASLKWCGIRPPLAYGMFLAVRLYGIIKMTLTR